MKWEYEKATSGNFDSLLARANDLGKDGWECIGFTLTSNLYYAFFKRKIPDKEKPAPQPGLTVLPAELPQLDNSVTIGYKDPEYIEANKPPTPASPDKTIAYPAFPSWKDDDCQTREHQW